MKYLIILGVIALAFYILLFWRMRRYFPLVRKIFGLTRDIYRVTRGAEGSQPVSTQKRGEGGKLVRCASCSTWIPSSRALQLRSSASVYCSTACLEKDAARLKTEQR